MKRFMALVCTVCILLTLTSVVSALESGQNLLSNPGFEEGTTGWTGGTLTSETTVKKSGEKSLKAELNGTVQGRILQDVDVEGGKVYLFGGEFMALDGYEGNNVQMYVEGVSKYKDEQKIDAKLSAGEWKQAARTYRASADGKARMGLLAPSTNMYADDMYAGELIVDKIDINGESSISIPVSATTQRTYTAKIYNQMGNSVGVATESVVWSLKEDYKGISVDAAKGVVTVSSTADEGTIELVALCTPSFNAQSSVTQSYVITLTKEPITPEVVKVNMLTNPGFENDSDGWSNIAGITSTEAHNGEKSAMLSWGSAAQRASQLVTVAPHATYIAGAWVKAENEAAQGTTVQIYAENRSSNPNMTSDSSSGAYNTNAVTSAGEWKQAVRLYETDQWESEGDISFGLLSERSTCLVDDVYFGKLVIDRLNITGSSSIEIPTVKKTVRASYSTSPVNQLGNTMGIGITKVYWKLKDVYDGVSIDELSGNLSVSSEALSGVVTLQATCYPTFNTDVMPMVSEEFDIRLVQVGETAEPQIRNLKITGSVVDGGILKADYSFYQKDGNQDESTYQWYFAQGEGEQYTPINGATQRTYTIPTGGANYRYKVEIMPKDNAGNVSQAVLSAAAMKPTAPTVDNNITLLGDVYVGGKLVADYTFIDPNGDEEGVSTFRWFRGETQDSLKPIDGATEKEYVLGEDDIEKWIAVGVTAVSKSEPYEGKEVISAAQKGPTTAIAKGVSIKGTVAADSTVTAEYTYFHPYGWQEKDTLIRWLLDGSVVSRDASYRIPSNAEGSVLTLEIIPGCEFAPFYGESFQCNGGTVNEKRVGWSSSVSGGGGGGGRGNSSSSPISSTVTAPQVHKEAFTDIISHWGKAAINNMAQKGIVSGVGNDRFEPDRPVSRCEFIAMVIRLTKTDDVGTTQIYDDVKSTDWFYSAVQTASRIGIINGRGDGFDPYAIITREEAAVILVKAYEQYQSELGAEEISFEDEEKISSWAEQSVAKALKVSLLKGDDNNAFRPQDGLTRAEAAVVMERLYEAFYGGDGK